MNRIKPKQLDYTARIFTAFSTLNLSPQLVICRVAHDDGCPMRFGKGKCRCVPDITLETTSGKIEVLRDGSCRYQFTLN